MRRGVLVRAHLRVPLQMRVYFAAQDARPFAVYNVEPVVPSRDRFGDRGFQALDRLVCEQAVQVDLGCGLRETTRRRGT